MSAAFDTVDRRKLLKILKTILDEDDREHFSNATVERRYDSSSGLHSNWKKSLTNPKEYKKIGLYYKQYNFKTLKKN